MDPTQDFHGELIRDARGREVVRFTTRSGVCAVVATCISAAALDKMARSLQRKIRRGEAKTQSKVQRVPPRLYSPSLRNVATARATCRGAGNLRRR